MNTGMGGSREDYTESIRNASSVTPIGDGSAKDVQSLDVGELLHEGERDAEPEINSKKITA
jgi:hypothetical protein